MHCGETEKKLDKKKEAACSETCESTCNRRKLEADERDKVKFNTEGNEEAVESATLGLTWTKHIEH